MPTLWVTRGLPGSGKSTKAKAWVDVDPASRARVNRDDLRAMFHGGRLGTSEQERHVTAAQHTTIRALLRAGLHVVADDTNLYSKFVRALHGIAVEEGAAFKVWDLSDVPLDVCLDRDAGRPAPQQVGEAVIRDMWERHIRPLKGRPFPPLTKPAEGGTIRVGEGQMFVTGPCVQPEPGTAPEVILVDLDGTAALMSGRSPYEWARVGEDSVNEPVREAVLALAARGRGVVFMSGRDEVCRDDTQKWIANHFWEVRDAPLFMRPAGDQRKDAIVKAELFDRHIRGKYRITAVFDDRQQVVRMWRALGLTVFQVAEGAF